MKYSKRLPVTGIARAGFDTMDHSPSRVPVLFEKRREKSDRPSISCDDPDALADLYHKLSPFYRVVEKGQGQIISTFRWDPTIPVENTCWAVPTFETWIEWRSLTFCHAYGTLKR